MIKQCVCPFCGLIITLFQPDDEDWDEIMRGLVTLHLQFHVEELIEEFERYRA